MSDILALYPASRRERRKARNRKAIVNAAKKLFAERGHQSVGVRDIVRETDLASGTFYNYFESIDQLIEEIASESVSAFKLYLGENATGAETLIERIEAAYRSFFDYTLFERANSGAALGSFLVGEASPGARGIAEEARNYISDLVSGLDLDERKKKVSTAMAIGMAKELALSNSYSNQDEADEIAAQAADLFAASLNETGVNKRLAR